MYSFFFANTQSTCFSHMYYKTDTNAGRFSPSLECFYDRTPSQAQKKFHDGNSVIEK